MLLMGAVRVFALLSHTDLVPTAERKRAILRFPVSPRVNNHSMEDEVAML